MARIENSAPVPDNFNKDKQITHNPTPVTDDLGRPIGTLNFALRAISFTFASLRRSKTSSRALHPCELCRAGVALLR